jgi:hypothetical protein
MADRGEKAILSLEPLSQVGRRGLTAPTPAPQAHSERDASAPFFKQSAPRGRVALPE